MLYGIITITYDEIAKLNEEKSLEIVLNRLLDVSEYAILLRADDKYLAEGFVADFSIKQGGYATDISANIEFIDSPVGCANTVTIINGVVANTDLQGVKSSYIAYIKCLIVSY